MIFRFPCMRTDKVSLARSMRVARLYMKAFYPNEAVMSINYNQISNSMDVHTVPGTETDIVYVCAHKYNKQEENDVRQIYYPFSLSEIYD